MIPLTSLIVGKNNVEKALSNMHKKGQIGDIQNNVKKEEASENMSTASQPIDTPVASDTKVANAVIDLKECIMKHKGIITAIQATQFTKENLEKKCDFKYISKAHFTAYFVKWDEGDTTYAGLSEQYKGNSSGTYGDPEKKSFLNNGSEIYTEFSDKVIKKRDKLRKSIIEVSSNITYIQNKIKSYQDDISHIKLKNNKLQTNVDLLITELDNIQKLFNN
ncbi:MAG: hypothetical protein HFJ12_04195 [Bacilli bacterium]|nr:hypothetical protein [Bacilli bacterium]